MALDNLNVDIMVEGKFDEDLHEDAVMSVIDAIIDEETEAEEEILKGEYAGDTILVDIVDDKKSDTDEEEEEDSDSEDDEDEEEDDDDEDDKDSDDDDEKEKDSKSDDKDEKDSDDDDDEDDEDDD